ncbi:MAG: hypothetical protein IT445_18900 [Phycisphaeraceae bacterium]|nr:hypothetical protein [Phycisphaeraceae bacterium]
MKYSFAIVAVAGLMLAGCAGHKTLPDDAPNRELVAGYSLLYSVIRDEANVDGLFILRKPSESTRSVVTSIAEAARQAKKDLEHMAAADPQLRLDITDLPAAEAEARSIVAAATSKRLLFGDDFERALLLSQLDATQYMGALAQHLGQRELNADRAATFRDLARRMEELYGEVLERIEIKTW